jgi:hypothetical protein
MDNSKTTQTRKMVAVTYYRDGRKVQAFVKGEVGEDGKTRIDRITNSRIMTALGIKRGQTYSTG